MTLLDTLQMSPVVQAIGWALVHSLWQLALVWVVLLAILWRMRDAGAAGRYLVGCAGMVAMLLAPVVTGLIVWTSLRSSAAGGLGGAPLLEAAAPVRDGLAAVTPALTITWLIGVFALQARLVLHLSHAHHLKRYGTRSAPHPWPETLDRLARDMGIRATVRIVESSLAEVPMVIGWLRPVILVPASAWTGLSPQQLEAIIVHELTHVRRHDYLVNLVQAVFETLLFYHPATWWLSHRLRIEREYCCDDSAVHRCGDRLAYARALATLEDLRDPPGEVALASTGGSLMDRITRLVGIPTVARRSGGGWLGAGPHRRLGHRGGDHRHHRRRDRRTTVEAGARDRPDRSRGHRARARGARRRVRPDDRGSA